MTWHKARLWELLSLWGARFLCFSGAEAPVSAHSRNVQRLVVPYTMKSEMVFPFFTYINRNRMCLSKWWHMLKEKPRESWLGHFKVKKDHSIAFSCFTSILPVLRDSDFYHLPSVEDGLLFYFKTWDFLPQPTCGFTVFTELQQQKKPPFGETSQAVFVWGCCHHSGHPWVKASV